MKTVELSAIKEEPADFEQVEKVIKDLFRKEIYLPLLEELGEKSRLKLFKNEDTPLLDAIRSGRIRFYRGQFTGRFDAATSRELKQIGASWDRKIGTFKIPLASLPPEITQAIDLADSKFLRTIQLIDRRLAQMLPEEIADKLKIEKIFERLLFKTERKINASMKGLVVAPKLTEDQAKRLAREWTNNMNLYIKEFSEKEIKQLRKDVRTSVTSGNRYENLVKQIESSFGVSSRKAKFLARQETNLMTQKFKASRYQDVGVKQYRWACVAGSSGHPVRHMHKALEGKIFSWNDPPITNEKGGRNNPGEDFNCRCFAKPIVRF